MVAAAFLAIFIALVVQFKSAIKRGACRGGPTELWRRFDRERGSADRVRRSRTSAGWA